MAREYQIIAITNKNEQTINIMDKNVENNYGLWFCESDLSKYLSK